MTQKTREAYQTAVTTAIDSGGRNSAAEVLTQFLDLSDSAMFPEDIEDIALDDLDTVVTGAELDAMQTKLATIDENAKATLADLSDVEDATPADGDILVYRSGSGTYEYEAKPSSSGSPAWGSLTGAMSDQADLQAVLDDKAAETHEHATTDVTSGTFASARISAASVTQHQASLAIAGSQVTSGTLPDARIAETGVTQHEAALEIAASQVSGLSDVAFVTVASSRALLASDVGKVLRVTATVTLTVDTGIFTEGEVIGIRVAGASVTATIADGTGFTITQTTGYAKTISVNRATAFLHFVSASTADLGGGLDAA